MEKIYYVDDEKLGEFYKLKKYLYYNFPEINLEIYDYEGKVIVRADKNIADKIFNVIEALSVGFKFKDVKKSLETEESYRLMEFNIKDVIVGVREKKKEVKRISSLIIGEKGRSIKKLEELTGCKLILDDKKGILYAFGKEDRLEFLVKALNLFLKGLKHGKIWEILERDLKREKLKKLLLDEEIIDIY